jgi:hypothetical protein
MPLNPFLYEVQTSAFIPANRIKTVESTLLAKAQVVPCHFIIKATVLLLRAIVRMSLKENARFFSLAKTALILLLFGSLVPYCVPPTAWGEASVITWARTYGGFLDDFANSIQPTTDGGYIVAGQTKSFGAGVTDAWVMKLDSRGNPEWQKTYGGHNHDEAWSVDQTTDGGYIVAGGAQSFDIARRDAWLFKLDPNGQIEWEKAYGEKQGEWFYSAEQTSDGGYIAAGITNSFGLDSDFGIGSNSWIVKTDSEGNIEWERTYGDGGDDWWYQDPYWTSGRDLSFSVHETTDAGFIVSGATNSFRVGSSGDPWLFKLDSNGDIEWEKVFAQHARLFINVKPTLDGGYIASGEGLVVKLDSDANLEWEKNIWAEDVSQSSEGGFIVTGPTFRSEDEGDLDVSLVKLDALGNIEWQKGYDGFRDQIIKHVHQTSDGGFVVSTDQAEVAYSDAWILKVGPDGGIADCIDAIVYNTNNTRSEAESEFYDTTSEITNSSATVIPSSAEVKDIDFTIAAQCGSPSEDVETYSLSLFENGDDHSDGFIVPGTEVRALAETNDPAVSEVEFRWINPDGEVVRAFGIGSVSGPVVAEQDFLSPDGQGRWTIEADFGNGHVARKTIELSFFVLPESPVGAIGMIVASLGALSVFSYLRKAKK